MTLDLEQPTTPAQGDTAPTGGVAADAPAPAPTGTDAQPQPAPAGSTPAEPTPTPATAPPAGHWADQFGKVDGVDALKQYASPQDFLNAHKALQERVNGLGEPVTDPAQYKLQMPQGLEADPGMMSWFTTEAAKRGWSQKQAQDVADAYVARQLAESKTMAETFESTMRQEWGDEHYEQNLRAVNEQIDMVDRLFVDRFKAQSGEFTKWVQSSPLIGSHPQFGRLMFMMRTAIDRRALAGDAVSRGFHTGEMSAEEFLSHRLQEQIKHPGEGH